MTRQQVGWCDTIGAIACGLCISAPFIVEIIKVLTK